MRFSPSHDEGRARVFVHTGKILAELGYDEDAVAALRWSAAK